MATVLRCRRAAALAALMLSALLVAPASLRAQVGGLQQAAGVVVDAQGVLRKQTFEDPTGQLMRERMAASKAALEPALAAPSRLRKVSLTRLERELQSRIGKDQPPTGEMLHLAGLTRVRYVFYYPDTKDVVLAGPAEGWTSDLAGRARGMYSGHPVLMLEDLIVALRAFPPDMEGTGVIGCSIDPTPEGLQRMQDFLRQVGAQATPDQTDQIVEGLRTSMGMQNVRVMGVSPKTHFAQVLVEADYRMKLIGIGLEKPPVKLDSYVDRAKASDVGRNALQRWYFTPDYQCVKVSDDALAMELVGDGVKLVGEDEVVAGGGERRRAATANKASQQFVYHFTQKYPQLAEKEPVYAQLRNLIDLSIVAAHIQQQDYYQQAEWRAETFHREEMLPVETYHTPVQVETVVTSVWRGNRLMTPVGGGVTMQPELALDSSNLLSDEEGKLQKAREELKLPLAEGQWWWD